MVGDQSLKKIKYANLDYGCFTKLKQKFNNTDYDPESEDKLDLSCQGSSSLPSRQILELMPNLRILVLAGNKICRFDGTMLVKYCKKLEWIDFSNNLIDVLDDLIMLGSLENCQALDISGNPVLGYLKWINVLEQLLYPEKFKPYDPVRILTADYQVLPKPVYDEKTKIQQQSDRIISQKFPEELAPHECYVKVSKYNHKKTLAKYAAQPCPVPRLSRFKNLIYLNDREISIFDAMRVSQKRDIKQIVEDQTQFLIEKKLRKKFVKAMGQSQSQNQNSINVKNLQSLPLDVQKWLAKKQEKEKYLVQYKKEREGLRSKEYQNIDLRDKQSKHEYYLKKYKNKIMKELQDAASNLRAPPKDDNEDELDYLMKLDLMEMKRFKKTMDPKKYAADIWEVPLDVKYKNSEFTISMKDYKKMLFDYNEKKQEIKERKERKEEERKQKNRKVVNKKLKQDGFGDAEEFPSELDVSGDSDLEIKKLFKKRKEIKPRLNLEQDSDKFNSSVSSLDERLEENEKEKEEESFEKSWSERSSDLEEFCEYEQRIEDFGQDLVQILPRNLFSEEQKDLKVSQVNGSQEAPIFQTIRKIEQKRVEVEEKEKQRLETIKKLQQQHAQQKKQQIQSSIRSKEEVLPQEKGSEYKSPAKKGVFGEKESNTTASTQQNVRFFTDATKTHDEIKSQLDTQPNQETQDVIQIEEQEEGNEEGQQGFFKQMGKNCSKSEEKFFIQSQILPVSEYQLVLNRKKPFQGQQKNQVKKDDQRSFNISKKAFYQRSKEHLKKEQEKAGKQVEEVARQLREKNRQYLEKRDRIDDAVQVDTGNIFQVKKNFRPIQQQEQVQSSEENISVQRSSTEICQPKLQTTERQKVVVKEKERFFTEIKQEVGSKQGRISVKTQREEVNWGEEEFKKSDIALESLIPTQEQGLDQEFKRIYLYDPKNGVHQQIKKYKNTIDDAINLRLSAQEMNQKVKKMQQQTFSREGAYSDVENSVKPVSYEQVVEYLKLDPKVNMQGTRQPSEITEYKITRKEEYPLDENQITTWDLREIIYKVNNYENKREFKITEKDIMENLQQKGIPFEQKIKYYEWLEILENIKLKKTKTNEQVLSRLEKKELERAESNAHLAYHYQKLKKYKSPRFIEAQMKKLGVQQDEPGVLKFINEKEEKLAKAKIVDRRLDISHNPNYNRDKQERKIKEIENFSKKYPSITSKKLLQRSQENLLSTLKSEKNHLNQQQNLNKLDKTQHTNLSKELPPGFEKLDQAEQEFYYFNWLRDQNKTKYQPPPQQTFEEMVQQNLRKMQDNFFKQENKVLSVEEQMMRYAQQFKDKIQKREELKKNIDKYILTNQEKLKEFLEWNINEEPKRHDKDLCFKNYVKSSRDTKIQGLQ